MFLQFVGSTPSTIITVVARTRNTTIHTEAPAESTTQLGTGPLGGGVNLVASSADGVNHAIFSADLGDALLGDGSAQSPAVAPGRRVMFFIQDSSFNDLTPDGIDKPTSRVFTLIDTNAPIS